MRLWKNTPGTFFSVILNASTKSHESASGNAANLSYFPNKSRDGSSENQLMFFSNGNNDSTNLHFLGFYIDWHDFFLTWGQPGRNFSRWLHNFNGSMFINQVCRPKLKGSHKCNCGFTTYKYKAPFFSGSISPKFPVYTKQFVQRSKPKRPLTNGQHFRKKHRGFAPFRNGRVEGETPLGFRYFFPVGWPEAIADSGNWELGAQNGGCLCRGYVSSPKVYALQYYKILFH